MVSSTHFPPPVMIDSTEDLAFATHILWRCDRAVAPDIAPAYISPVAYQTYTCQQLALEAQAISTRAAAFSGAQDSQHTKDGWTTAAAVVIFWPAAFFVGGDKHTAAEPAQMKGQMVAIEQASIQKKCGIQFQGKLPVT